jgi:DNA-binding CsgD family transcriptional regulator
LAARFFDIARVGLREQGRLAVLGQVLTMGAWDKILLGDWIEAAAAAEEGWRLANETGQPIWSCSAGIARALLAGVRGESHRSEQLVVEAEATAIPRGLSALQCVAAFARGITALGDGRHSDAFDHLRRMFDPGDPAYHHADRFMGIGYLADAAGQVGQRELARGMLRELEALSQLTCSPALRLGIAYARPVLADESDAERLYHVALSELRGWPFTRARLQLAYGVWLRRQRRIAESRAPLRSALGTLEALGARGWSERARQELAASGQYARERAPHAYGELTPQELQIAQMAAAGLSNREIAEQLYLSPRTVATHLYRVFPKLAITSRAQLRAALSDVATPTLPAIAPAPRGSDAV